MNLSNITAKAWILALFIRDDGQRFLLGDGWYDFKDSLQHFQPNTIANDIVELQGADGQLLAGQVRRSGEQVFEGYIGDASMKRADIETHRTDFINFFQARHRYKVVYIFANGTAIQRRRGYLVEPPSVPEMWQKFPEYSVTLSFEEVPYYQYAENSSGTEIYANNQTLTALASAVVGYHEADYLTNISTAFPQTLNTRFVGNLSQASTPTPDSPVPIRVARGLETFVVSGGKNLLMPYWGYTRDWNGITFTWENSQDLIISGVATADAWFKSAVESKNCEVTLPAGDYIFSVAHVPSGCSFRLTDKNGNTLATDQSGQFTLNAITQVGVQIKVASGTDMSTGYRCRLQIERGSTSTVYDRFRGSYKDLNLGKNLFDGAFEEGIINGTTGQNAANSSYIRGTNYIPVDESTSYTISSPDYSGNWLWYEYKSDKSYNLSTNKSGTTITTDPNTRYIRIRPNSSGLSTSLRAQVEAGGVATSYAAYFAPIELYSGIASKVDVIYPSGSSWELLKQLERIDLDGTTEGTWTAVSGYSNLFYNDSFPVAAEKTDNIPFCTHFKGVQVVASNTAASAIADNSICFLNNASPTNRCYIKTTKFSTAAQLTSWLASHSVSVFYRRATTSTTTITNAALLAQLNAIGAQVALYAPSSLVFSRSKGDNIPMKTRLEYLTTANEKTITISAGGAKPVWTVSGGATNPTLRNVTTGKAITYTGTLGANNTLVVDMAQQTATVNGVNAIANISGDWIEFAGGANVVAYKNDSNSGTSKIEWDGVVG